MHPSLKLRIITDTTFGPIVVIWAELDGLPRVVRVLLAGEDLSAIERAAKLYPETEEDSCSKIERVAGALRGFLEGSAITIPLEMAAFELCSPFQRSVLRAAARIPRGSVGTYGGLAESRGRAARAAGNALAANPFPLIVPCHRVIRSDGRIGGFTGGQQMKRMLLELEGIRFDDAGRLCR